MFFHAMQCFQESEKGLYQWRTDNVYKTHIDIQNLCMKMRLTLENLYAKFGLAHWSRLAVASPNSPGYPKMQNFGTLFFQLWNFFLSLWVIVPFWNFGIRLVHIIWFSKSNLMKLANLFLIFWLKMSRIENYKILKKFKMELLKNY